MEASASPIAAIDRLIRTGRHEDARLALEKLSREGNLSKHSPAKIANLFWRTGQASRGIRFLGKYLPGLLPAVLEGNPEAAAEYAACLLRLGAYMEAEWILKLDRVLATPKARLYLSFVHLETWNYAEAIPVLEQYVETPRLADYWKKVGLVNLAGAYVYERRHAKARALLRGLLHEARLGQNLFLLGYVLEVAAADRVLAGEFESADQLLTEAASRWTAVDGLERFFLDKWRAILDLMQTGDAAAIARVRAVQTQAAQLRHWETIRDCDRYLAVRTKDEALFQKLSFGTPFRAFRERLQRDFGSATLPERYVRSPGGAGGSPARVDLIVDEAARKKTGLVGHNHALLSLMLSDFYRPHRLARLFAEMFPEEHYHALHSPKRLHQAVRRLNAWFKSQKLEMAIEEIHSEYRLVAAPGIEIVVPRPEGPDGHWRPFLKRLSEKFGVAPFATREALEALGLPRRTLIRQLQSLVATGRAEQSGAGSATRYKLVSNG